MPNRQLLQSFVAHIWLEHGANGETVWRGRIRHVQSRKARYVNDIEQMAEFIRVVTGLPWKGTSAAGRGGAELP